VEVVNVIAGENGGVAEFIGRGTHTGPLTGPAGTIPPTGRRIEFPLCDVWKVRDGRFAGNRCYYDLLGLLGQLGVIPAPAALDISGATIGTPVHNS
jgi:predicted ester cyclase